LKTPDKAMDLIENMAASDIAILRDRAHIPTKKSLLEPTSRDALLAQNKSLSKQLEALTETLSKLPTQIHSAHTSHASVLQVAGCTILGELMNLDVVSLLKNNPLMKSITWEISPEIILMQEDFLNSNMASNTINNRDNGGTTLGINSIEIKVDHPQGLVSMIAQRS